MRFVSVANVALSASGQHSRAVMAAAGSINPDAAAMALDNQELEWSDLVDAFNRGGSEEVKSPVMALSNPGPWRRS